MRVASTTGSTLPALLAVLAAALWAIARPPASRGRQHRLARRRFQGSEGEDLDLERRQVHDADGVVAGQVAGALAWVEDERAAGGALEPPPMRVTVQRDGRRV